MPLQIYHWTEKSLLNKMHFVLVLPIYMCPNGLCSVGVTWGGGFYAWWHEFSLFCFCAYQCVKNSFLATSIIHSFFYITQLGPNHDSMPIFNIFTIFRIYLFFLCEKAFYRRWLWSALLSQTRGRTNGTMSVVIRQYEQRDDVVERRHVALPPPCRLVVAGAIQQRRSP